MAARIVKLLSVSASAALLVACGGGGSDYNCSPCVKSGFIGDLDWEFAAGRQGEGIGGGADGGGGVGAGAGYGQFRNALVVVKYPDGTPVGEALTDPVRGMVTIMPGSDYQGPLLVEVHGQPGATYFEEGKNRYVPYEPGQVQHSLIPFIGRNIGITPFSEAAYQLSLRCHTGTGPQEVCGQATAGLRPAGPQMTKEHGSGGRHPKADGGALPAAATIAAANAHVTEVLNRQLPSSLQVDDVTRLPFIVNDGTGGEIAPTPRGRYGLANIAFSKQAAMYNNAAPAPTLLAATQLSGDLGDGKFDGIGIAGPASQRTYDPHTFTGELSAALAQQTTRYGQTDSISVLPAITAFGNTRYDSYYFDATLEPSGATSTIAVATEAAGGRRTPGERHVYVDPEKRGFMLYGNMGSGALFIKTDSPDSTGSILAIGDNSNGELGNGTNESTGRSGPATLILPAPITHAAGGIGHTVARLADGSVYAWGDNTYGQLGQGTGGTALRNSFQPVRVNLPSPALAVAASNQASFALLEDSSVHSWGSGWGFGTLGDNTANGERVSPGPVLSTSGPLTGVVQISARDNDAVAVKADGSIWTWGSFSAQRIPGSGLQRVGPGYTQATRFEGVPATTGGVRKVLTEQGVFAAVVAGRDASGADLDGAVYSWGIYFDITADQVLHDLAPTRVLNLPPVRDLMPGGFLGYGQRPSDRLTAMAIDYAGGLWKIRGQVAEEYDPANPTRQRRPKGQVARPDCANCHVVKPKELPPIPSTGPTCAVPGHILSLLTTQSKCQNCHNEGRLASGRSLGPLNCVPPPLQPRGDPVPVSVFTNQCALPAAHPVVQAKASCASCHNSVVLDTLKCSANEPPLKPPSTTALTITGATDDMEPATGPIAPGGITNDTTPILTGTLNAPLGTDETIRLLAGPPDGTPSQMNVIGIAQAAPGGLSWQGQPGQPLQPGNYAFAARVDRAASVEGVPQGSFLISIVTTVPQKPVTITAIVKSSGEQINAAGGNLSNDSTPTLRGTVTGGLASGERLILRRAGPSGGSQDITLAATDSDWTYTEPQSLPDGNYVYSAQVLFPNGVQGGFGTERTVIVDTTPPAGEPLLTVSTTRPGIASELIAEVAGTRESGLGISSDVVTLAANVRRAVQGDRVEFRVRVGDAEPVRVGSGPKEVIEGVVSETHRIPGAEAALALRNGAPNQAVPSGATINLTYEARVLDRAGNVGNIVASSSHQVGLFSCEELRARHRHQSAGAKCSDCHLQSGNMQFLPGVTNNPPRTPNIAVGYWCTFGAGIQLNQPGAAALMSPFIPR